MSNLTKVKDLINYIVEEKARGNSFQILNTQMKLMLKGIPVKNILEDKFEEGDPDELERLIVKAANELNVQLPKTILQK